MTNHKSSNLIKTITPDRILGLSMDFIEAGYFGLLVKNGRVIEILHPGRHFTFAFPLLVKCQIVLVDSKLRNLEIRSTGDFLSRDQFLINVSINVMYQVVNPQKVALEMTDPVNALEIAIKDILGQAIAQFTMQQMLTYGRTQIREHILNKSDVAYAIGFALDDVRINDISFPQTQGIVRQIEGMSANEEAERQAERQAKIAQAKSPYIPPQSPVQVNIIGTPNQPILSNQPSQESTLFHQIKPANPTHSSNPTLLNNNLSITGAYLVNKNNNQLVKINKIPFTIGREATNHLIVVDALCSRQHAKIEIIQESIEQTQYQLIDLGSSNGTYVFEQRLKPFQAWILKTGQIITIGQEQWIFNNNS